MKFGNLLRSTSIELPEVTCLFNTYKQLKKQLKRLPDRDQVSAAVGDAQQQQALTQDEAQFVATIDNNLANLNNMFLEREEEAVIRLERLQQATAAAADDEQRRTVYKQLVDFHGEVLLLVHWSVLAYTATVKILKKHHKRTGLLLRAPQLENLLSQPFCSTEVMSQLARKAEACVQELAAALAGTTPVPASSADVSGAAAAHTAAGAAEAGAGPSAPVRQTDAANERPGGQSAAPAGPSDVAGAAAGAAGAAAASGAQGLGSAAYAQLLRSSSRTDLGWQAHGSTLGLAEAQGEVEGDTPAGDSPAGGSPAGHSPAGGSPAGGDMMEGLQGWSPAESGSGVVVGPAVWAPRPTTLSQQAGPGVAPTGMDAAAPQQQQEAQAGPSHPPQQPPHQPHQGTLISSTTSTSSTELSSVCREGSDVEDAGLAGLHQLLAAHPAWSLRAGASKPEAQDAATSAPAQQLQQQQQDPAAGAAAATSSAVAPAAAEAGAAGAVACSEEHSGVVGGGSPRSRGHAHGHAQAPPQHHHRHMASVLRRTQLALDTWLQLRTNAHSPSTVLPPEVTTGGAGAGPSRLAGSSGPAASVPACSNAAVAGAAAPQPEGVQGTAAPASHRAGVTPSGEQQQGMAGSKRAREEEDGEGEGDAAGVVQHLQKRQA